MTLSGGYKTFYKNGNSCMPKYIFNHLQELSLQMDNRHLLLFLDYDGTLVTFKNKPDVVKTPSRVKTILRDLNGLPWFTVVLITGRTLESIKTLVDNEDIIIGALHGLTIEFPDNESFIWKKAEKSKSLISHIKHDALEAFGKNEGVYLEDKEVTLALHYRQAPKSKTEGIVRTFIHLVKERDTTNQLELLHGAKVIEARPRGWHKGKAVDKITESLDINSDPLSMYIGDDVTDEDAFRRLKDTGITIFVSHHAQRTTYARYFLHGPDEVYRFLTWLKNVRGECTTGVTSSKS